MSKKKTIITLVSIFLINSFFSGCMPTEFPEINSNEPLGLIGKPWSDYAVNTDYIEDWIPAGTYMTGADISVGEYFMIPIDKTADSYFKVNKLDENNRLLPGEDSKQFLSFSGFCFIELSEYCKIEITNAKMVLSEKAPQITAIDGFWGAGVYRVGVDIPADEYFFEADPNEPEDYSWKGVVAAIQKEYSGVPPKGFISIPMTTFAYATVENGEYLCVGNGTRFSPSSNEHKIVSNNGVYPEGHYLVGRDIQAGKYLLKGEEGYYSINENSRNELSTTIKSRTFKRSVTIDLSDGQYVLIENANFMATG